jgi:hypothetical protein
MQAFLKGNPMLNAVVASVVAIGILLGSFSLFEPIVTHGQANDTFTVRQQITSEISFLTPAPDVTMTPAIAGITGGNAFGTTTFNISTNDPDGYNVTIAFATGTAMQGENITSDIPNYAPDAGAGNADYTFSAIGAGEAGFAYSVNSTTTPQYVDPTFKNNGSTCGGGSPSNGHCWYNRSDADTAETIINATSSTAVTGATSTLVFQVGVGNTPSPALQTGFYNATATLTATNN